MKNIVVALLFLFVAFVGIASTTMGVFYPSTWWMALAFLFAIITGVPFAKHAMSRFSSSKRSALYGAQSNWPTLVALTIPATALSYLFFLNSVGTYFTAEFGERHVRAGEISSANFRSSRRGVACVNIRASVQLETRTIYVSPCLPKSQAAAGVTGFSYFITWESMLGIVALPSRRRFLDPA